MSGVVRSAFGVRGVGPGVEQHPHHLGVDVLRSEEKRGRADPVQAVAVAVAEVGGHRRVHVDAGGEQPPDQVHAAPVAPALGRRHVADVGPAQPDDLVQRVPPLPGRVDVGAPVDQVDTHVVLAVHRRHDQRAGAVRERVVHVPADLEKGPDRVDLAELHREQQRGERGTRPRVAGQPHLGGEHATGLGRRRIAGARRDVGAARDEGPDGVRVVLGRRPHQRGLAPRRLGRVRVRAGRQQRLDDVDPSGAGGGHQHRLAVREPPVRIGAGGQQPGDDGRVAVQRGQGDRRDPVAVGPGRIGAGVEQQADDVGRVALHRPVQGGHAAGRRSVHVDRTLQQHLHRPAVTRAGRRNQRRLRFGRSRRSRRRTRHEGQDHAGDRRRQTRIPSSIHCHGRFSDVYRSVNGPVESATRSRSTPALWSRVTPRFANGVCIG